MKIRKLTSIAITVLSTIATLTAFSQDWEFSAGWSQRHITDIDFESTVLTSSNFSGQAGGDTYIGFLLDPALLSDEWQADTTNMIDIAGIISVTEASTTEDNDASDSDHANGFVLRLSHALGKSSGGYHISVDMGLGHYTINGSNNQSATTGSTAGFNINTHTFQLLGLPPIFDPATIPIDGTSDFTVPFVPDSTVAGLGVDTTISTTADFEAELWVISLGLGGALEQGKFKATGGVGSTVNIADADASFSHTTLIGGDPVTGAVKDGNTSIAFGFYAQIGLAYHLSDSIDIGANARYDIVSGDASTDLASASLDGESLDLIMSFRF
jgi:hypothetical protein